MSMVRVLGSGQHSWTQFFWEYPPRSHVKDDHMKNNHSFVWNRHKKSWVREKKTAFYSFSVLNIRTEQIINQTLTCEIWWASTVLDFLLLLFPDRAVQSDVGGWTCLLTHVSRRWGICKVDEKAAIFSHHKLADCLLIDKLFSFSIYSYYAYFVDLIFLFTSLFGLIKLTKLEFPNYSQI